MPGSPRDLRSEEIAGTFNSVRSLLNTLSLIADGDGGFSFNRIFWNRALSLHGIEAIIDFLVERVRF